jgi:ABC-type transport system substrate-binding protein
MRGILITSFVLGAVALVICILSTASWAARPSSTPPPNLRTSTNLASPTTLDPDDDDVTQELTYHWQNRLYTNDERHQMAYIVIFLCAVAASTGARKIVRSRRCAAKGAGQA